MDSLHDRALRALGWEPDPDGETMYELDGDGCRSIPAEETLIGMLLLELDRLTGRDFCYYAKDAFGDSEQIIHTKSRRIKCKSESILEALVLAVEAAQEGK